MTMNRWVVDNRRDCRSRILPEFFQKTVAIKNHLIPKGQRVVLRIVPIGLALMLRAPLKHSVSHPARHRSVDKRPHLAKSSLGSAASFLDVFSRSLCKCMAARCCFCLWKFACNLVAPCCCRGTTDSDNPMADLTGPVRTRSRCSPCLGCHHPRRNCTFEAACESMWS